MKNTLSIFKRELKSFFDSPMAYVFLIVFDCCGLESLGGGVGAYD